MSNGPDLQATAQIAIRLCMMSNANTSSYEDRERIVLEAVQSMLTSTQWPAASVICLAPDYTWQRLGAAEQQNLIDAAARDPLAAAMVICCTFPDRWASLSNSDRGKLIDAAKKDPRAASIVLVHLPEDR